MSVADQVRAIRQKAEAADKAYESADRIARFLRSEYGKTLQTGDGELVLELTARRDDIGNQAHIKVAVRSDESRRALHGILLDAMRDAERQVRDMCLPPDATQQIAEARREIAGRLEAVASLPSARPGEKQAAIERLIHELRGESPESNWFDELAAREPHLAHEIEMVEVVRVLVTYDDGPVSVLGSLNGVKYNEACVFYGHWLRELPGGGRLFAFCRLVPGELDRLIGNTLAPGDLIRNKTLVYLVDVDDEFKPRRTLRVHPSLIPEDVLPKPGVMLEA